ncbi:MAG: CmcI family methyltransferase [Fimbriimonadaceae bacterium]
MWNLRPASIFEIGSYNGASALWMADTLRTFGIQSHVTSLDIVKVTAIQDPDITFLAGSGREPEIAFPPELLASSPRPWLVIEDADHTLETSKAVLEYFHVHMASGDYFVIEDGATAEGPRLALAAFLSAHKGEYVVDASYCDFFGYNATWCINGFLRRL